MTSGKTAEQFAQEIVARKDRIREIIMSRLGFFDKAALASRVTELQQLGPEIQQLLQRGIDAKNAILKWRQVNSSDAFDARITKTHTAELQFVAELSQTFSDQGIANIASGGASAIKSFLDNNVPVLRGKIKKIIEEYGKILTDIKK